MTLYLNNSPVMTGNLHALQWHARINLKPRQSWKIKLWNVTIWTFPKESK